MLTHPSPRRRPRPAFGVGPLFPMLCLLALLFTPRPLYAQKLPDSPREEWQGEYLGQQKIGYSSIHITPITYQGKPALHETDHEITHIMLFGQTVEEDSDEDAILDARYQPLTQTMDMKSNGSVTHIEAKYDYTARKVYCTIGTGNGASHKTLMIPAGANLAADTNFAIGGEPLSVGQKLTLYTLNPATIALEPMHLEVTGKESVLDDNGKEIAAFTATLTTPIGVMNAWLDADGDLIKGLLSLAGTQMVMTRETKEHAMDMAFVSPALLEKGAAGSKTYTPPADFAVATSIQTNRPIKNPRHLRTLSATIDGVPDANLLLSDARQKETKTADQPKPPFKVTATIEAEQVETTKTAHLPLKDPALAPYLQKAAYLDTEDPAIRAIAAQLRGKETDTYRIACAIRDWVNRHMTPDASIGVPRSATDICQRRRGVCRDYATLYTALARAAGLPTRLCAGIVYGEIAGHAGFYYHAWAESYVGKWVAFDPTLYDPRDPVPFVDATHIKFAQGDVTDMFNSINVVGKLKITLMD